ncbi:hypothetical protein C1X50_32630, partial [Pseudomonas sp. MPR-TSA4]|uniref:hypothetical protein n=1 Tax=Pseudomonas sp. MPR-TSA4 TaxID=2070594 RepID=UPI000CAB0C63
QLLRQLSDEADRMKTDGKLDDKEHAVLSGLYMYLQSIEERFNAFNNTATALKLSGETVDALKIQLSGGSSASRDLLGRFSKELRDWGQG